MNRKGIIILYITWFAKSPELTPPDFFSLCGFVKDHVYRTPIRDLADLQGRFYAAVSNVTPQMLHNTWFEAEYQLDKNCQIIRYHAYDCLMANFTWKFRYSITYSVTDNT